MHAACHPRRGPTACTRRATGITVVVAARQAPQALQTRTYAREVRHASIGPQRGPRRESAAAGKNFPIRKALPESRMSRASQAAPIRACRGGTWLACPWRRLTRRPSPTRSHRHEPQIRPNHAGIGRCTRARLRGLRTIAQYPATATPTRHHCADATVGQYGRPPRVQCHRGPARVRQHPVRLGLRRQKRSRRKAPPARTRVALNPRWRLRHSRHRVQRGLVTGA